LRAFLLPVFYILFPLLCAQSLSLTCSPYLSYPVLCSKTSSYSHFPIYRDQVHYGDWQEGSLIKAILTKMLVADEQESVIR
jgi:hypothetical protein